MGLLRQYLLSLRSGYSTVVPPREGGGEGREGGEGRGGSEGGRE